MALRCADTAADQTFRKDTHRIRNLPPRTIAAVVIVAQLGFATAMTPAGIVARKHITDVTRVILLRSRQFGLRLGRDRLLGQRPDHSGHAAVPIIGPARPGIAVRSAINDRPRVARIAHRFVRNSTS